MKTERRSPRGPHAASGRNALKVVVVAVAATFLGLTIIQCAPSQQTSTNTATPAPQGAGESARGYGRRTGFARRVGGAQPQAAARAAATSVAPCPAVTPQQIYRFITPVDQCLTQMSPDDISKLNDPWAATVLRKNAGGAGLWPGKVADAVAAVNSANPGTQQFSYMLGEGSQIPASVTPAPTPGGNPVDANRNLRYVVTWGQSGQSPAIFLSAAPDGVYLPPGAEFPLFLQVISFDPDKQLYNYYQYVSNNDLNSADPGNVRTWSWAGDSSAARAGQPTEGQGCFACHRIGALNMKERTVPWNNWHSPKVSISPANVNAAVGADPLFRALSGADKFESVFEGVQLAFTSRLARGAVNSDRVVTNVPDMLKHLIQTTTVNFASSQATSASGSAISQLPVDFLLYDSALNGVLNLPYTRPNFSSLPAAGYSSFLTNNKFALVNTNANSLPPAYSVPGATYFAFFVPVPAYEDTKMIQQLVNPSLGIVSPQFAAAVLMVDFQNPVFSPARSSLMQYAQQITSGKADGKDIPNQFAALVKQAAASQPACDATKLSQCTAEQQFLYYWSPPSGATWQQAAVAQINSYMQNVNSRMAAPAGVNDYMTLSVSRGIQFANWPGVCNLHEFDLMLPCTSLGNVFVQMNTDGAISPQQPYTCPTLPQGFQSPCQSSVYTGGGQTPTAPPANTP